MYILYLSVDHFNLRQIDLFLRDQIFDGHPSFSGGASIHLWKIGSGCKLGRHIFFYFWLVLLHVLMLDCDEVAVPNVLVLWHIHLLLLLLPFEDFNVFPEQVLIDCH
jgi:hypothetical protein